MSCSGRGKLINVFLTATWTYENAFSWWELFNTMHFVTANTISINWFKKWINSIIDTIQLFYRVVVITHLTTQPFKYSVLNVKIKEVYILHLNNINLEWTNVIFVEYASTISTFVEANTIIICKSKLYLPTTIAKITLQHNNTTFQIVFKIFIIQTHFTRRELSSFFDVIYVLFRIKERKNCCTWITCLM